MPRAYKVLLAGVAGFAITSGSIIGYWFATVDSEDCGRDCGLAYAAVITWGLVVGALIGVACAFVAYAATGRPRDRT
jgi:hypothetical protein